MCIYPSRHSLILDAVVRANEMADPTEAHEFTFGCYRAVDVTLDDAENQRDASDAGAESDHTVLTDGGFVGATTCPSCESDLANVQGVPDCTHCAWTAS